MQCQKQKKVDLLELTFILGGFGNVEQDMSDTKWKCSFSTPCLFTSSLRSPLSLQEKQYSEWMAACKLASKGLTLLDSSYQTEVKNIQAFLSMQRSNSSASTPQTDESINTQSLVSPRYNKKYKVKQVLYSSIWSNWYRFYPLLPVWLSVFGMFKSTYIFKKWWQNLTK